MGIDGDEEYDPEAFYPLLAIGIVGISAIIFLIWDTYYR
jgi:hypothetical protein